MLLERRCGSTAVQMCPPRCTLLITAARLPLNSCCQFKYVHIRLHITVNSRPQSRPSWQPVYADCFVVGVTMILTTQGAFVICPAFPSDNGHRTEGVQQEAPCTYVSILKCRFDGNTQTSDCLPTVRLLFQQRKAGGCGIALPSRSYLPALVLRSLSQQRQTCG